MNLDIISYSDLTDFANKPLAHRLKTGLSQNGIIGVSQVPHFAEFTQAYIQAARQFSALSEEIKSQYLPNRDEGETEGYELGAEKFLDANGNWQIDNKKASFYAFVPDHHKNKWPEEVDLKSSYLKLGQLIFETGKKVLQFIDFNECIGIPHAEIMGYGRMLHYHQENESNHTNPNWCGVHYDHGIFTGLAPAYYFKEGKLVEEPAEAGLYVKPTHAQDFIKIPSSDKSVLLFQVGEFGQLATHDAICATQHLVRKAKSNIERFTFALFFIGNENVFINSHSLLTKDKRYTNYKRADGSICYTKWEEASYARYRVI
jgi:isopenicillin N synthase-like dioxygenase